VILKTNLDAVFGEISALIGKQQLNDDEIGIKLTSLLSTLTKFDFLVVFAYQGMSRPLHLFSTFNVQEFDVFVTQYLDGPYLLDPFFHNAKTKKHGIWRMRELAPDRFFSSEYFKSYYAKTGLAEEVGFFNTVGADTTLVVSLMRKAYSGTFSTSELSHVKKSEPLVSAIIKHFWWLVEQRFASDKLLSSAKPKLATVWDRLSPDLHLTVREASVIELVLQGHSSESIGLGLGISTGTVKVHRRNVYRKLAISSQTQLFSLFFPI
jgi:DNA-binding CsgD family transcriptional regulator